MLGHHVVHGTTGQRQNASFVSMKESIRCIPAVVHDFQAEKQSVASMNPDLEAYPNLPFATGLVKSFGKVPPACSPEWAPVWNEFPLKIFRGSVFKHLKVQKSWDDETLLRELKRTYDQLRTFWRKWFSLKNVRYALLYGKFIIVS
jgi:hypothetical protein